jgi:transposase
LIYDWLTTNPELSFMQDGAPGHRAKATYEEFARRGIERKRIFWPPYSPDLNLIESIWNKIKDYIQAKFPFEKNKLTYVAEYSISIAEKLLHHEVLYRKRRRRGRWKSLVYRISCVVL